MLYKAIFVTGFGAGYVLGARAGRERYDTIARSARSFVEEPKVQETAVVVQAQLAGAAGKAREKVTAKVGGKPVGSASTASTAPSPSVHARRDDEHRYADDLIEEGLLDEKYAD